MDEVIERLEERSYEVKETLETEAVIMQEKANQAIEYGKDSRAYNLRRGEIRRKIESLESLYEEGKALLALSDELGVSDPEEEREEEVRIAKEKWFGSTSGHPYQGRVAEAMDAHVERQREARNQEILTHGTPAQSLRNAIKQYEMLLYRLGEEIEGLDPDTPYEPVEYDSELIEESFETEDEPEDLTEELFSQW